VSFWRRVRRGVRGLALRPVVEREAEDELQHYVTLAAAEHRTRGLSAADAARAARAEFGSLTSAREQMRGDGWEVAFERLAADIRFAARRLRSEPGFTALTVFTLALALGSTTAIFSAVSPILFESLPYPDARQLVAVSEIGRDGARVDGTFGMYSTLAARTRSLRALAAYRHWQPTVTGDGQPERLDGQRVNATWFDVLGIQPAAGRGFHPADDVRDGPRVVVITDALWRRRFGSDAAIVGSEIILDGERHQIVGVMPAGFESVLAPSAQIWAPLQYDLSQGRAWGHHLRAIGRMQDGTNADRATRELDALGNTVLAEQRPETYGAKVQLVASSLHQEVTRGVRRALLAILGAVALLLVIAAVNVTNMLLARAAQRRGEFALRAALGAGRRRLVRQVLTESLLLAGAGGVLGVGVAMLLVRALVALAPPDLPRLGAIHVDGGVYAFGLVITTLIGLGFGALPALQASRSDPQRALQEGSRRSAGSISRTRATLVVAEVALALVLLVSAGLLLRSLQRLFAIDAGFDASGLLTMQIQTSGRGGSDGDPTQFFAQSLEAVRRVPGVGAAALTSQLPLSGDDDLYGVHFDPSPDDDPGELQGTYRYAVSPGYIETMRIALRSGRVLDERDHAGSIRSVLISESMAKRRLPGRDPIGQRLRIGAADGPLYTVVGVVGNVKQVSLAMNEADAVYVPAVQWHSSDAAMSLIVRARGDASELVAALRAAVWSVDKDQPIVRVATMEDLMMASAAERRFALIIFEAFAIAALVLAAAGTYGVISGSVVERTREIGVRSALGLPRSGILALVLREGLLLTACGVAVGLIGAVAASRAVRNMLFDISPLDPLTYGGVVALLFLTAIGACGVPAWRASRVDPATTLRSG
jgi:putative ABC transport system permease protein